MKGILFHRGSAALWFSLVLIISVGGGLFLYYTDDSLKHRTLEDGTELYYKRGASFDVAEGFPENRAISVDGEFYIRAPKGVRPLTVESKLLQITVTGVTGFRIVAHSEKDGERVDVLYGQVHTEKNYESPVPEPVDLTDMQLLLINSRIDFLEKERLKDDEVEPWIRQIELQKANSAPE